MESERSHAVRLSNTSLVQHLREGHKRISAERDALAEELATLQRSQRAQRCVPCTTEPNLWSQTRSACMSAHSACAHLSRARCACRGAGHPAALSACTEVRTMHGNEWDSAWAQPGSA